MTLAVMRHAISGPLVLPLEAVSTTENSEDTASRIGGERENLKLNSAGNRNHAAYLALSSVPVVFSG